MHCAGDATAITPFRICTICGRSRTLDSDHSYSQGLGREELERATPGCTAGDDLRGRCGEVSVCSGPVPVAPVKIDTEMHANRSAAPPSKLLSLSILVIGIHRSIGRNGAIPSSPVHVCNAHSQ